MIRVVVADDQELVRDAFALILQAQDDIEVVGTAGDGRAAVQLVERTRPDVVLLDIRMPVLDGIQATRAIVAARSRSRVLILTTYDIDAYVLDALRAGAAGFLLKDSPRASMLAAVRAVAQGEVLIDADVAARLIDEHLPGVRDPATAAALSRLTPRERDVLHEISVGRTNAEIAATLYVSEATVKTHVAHLLDKLRARDRVHLVLIAHGRGDTVKGAD
ncbi:response regulator transcription factor [Actinoplanes sp. URMC 104]|uniref:response regulator transcription factor n=1 Tax=Actinoplanes sp. URMC 104 TaxID=3423409 RepID=UPI003F19C855